MASAIEEPRYEVITAWEEHSIELRSYAPRLLAVTTMTQGQNNGFRVLAGYIFGGNTKKITKLINKNFFNIDKLFKKLLNIN